MAQYEIFNKNINNLAGNIAIVPSLIYCDVPYNTGNNFDNYSDKYSLEEYSNLMKDFFNFAIATSKDLTIVVQCDWHSTHIIRTIGDELVGAKNYSNEIIWNYNSGGASTKRPSRKHDTLHVWNIGNHVYNQIREPYPHKYSGKVAEKMHPDGRVIQDVWNDISFIGTSSPERTGYSTQKPIKLLNRVINLWSNEGDWIVDPMCGSGTTGVAAINLNRNVLLNDVNPDAVAIAKDRLATCSSKDDILM